ncbi:MAG: putative DNA binding domain-containing protein [Clostridia bacterium]|nr:putative DNA binding domain-containing protein [Clostridia bacterium]
MNLGLESEKIEFKKSTSELIEGVVSISAMLNKHGEGTIYFGVKNNGDVIGQKDINEDTLRDVSRKIAEGIKPQIIPTIALELVEDKKIIRVDVKGNDIPYSAFGKYYSRSYDEDKQLSPEMLKSLINKDGEPDSIVKKESLKQDLTFKMLKGLYISNDLKINNEKFEQNLGLFTNDNRYNYMAELLADSNDISIKVVTFAGVDKTVMLKRTEYGGKCLLMCVRNVLEYMESINETKVKVSGLKRQEEKYFDFNCFKEAWLNACIHTRWSEEIPPAVYIYDNRIEVVSNGGLPSALSEEDFFEGVSKPTNKRLLKIFGDLDYIDQTGHGVPLIVKKYGKRAFYISKHTIIVTIPLNKDLLEEKETNKIVYTDLNESEMKVLNLIKNDVEYKTKDLMKITNFSEPYINKIIYSLKNKHYIKRIGANKNGHWKILK